MPTISTLTVDVVANTRSLSRGLKLASTAVIGIGVVATKMALDYEDAFTKISAVSNASAQDVEKWKKQVLELAGDTAKAPKELADALFFLASAGLKTNQIMPVLEASAKASAAGLGEVADISRLTANVLNAYAGSGLKAAQVTDTLVAAVREGSADTDEFGTAIGRILPIASTAGISFDSVAASLASLSNIGLDVNEGVTAMRGLFQALVAPGAAAREALAGVGLSAQELLTSLQEDGLVGTIRLLDSAVKKNTTTQADYMGTLREIVPNIRSLTGLLGLTSQEAERVDGIFRRVDDSTGSLATAFRETAEGPGFAFRQALTDIQVVLIQLGDLILPLLVSVVDFIQQNWTPAWEAVVEGFNKAWDAVQPFARTIGDILIPLFQAAWSQIKNKLLPALEEFKPLFILIGGAAVAFATVVLAQVAIVIAIISEAIKWIGKVVDAFMEVVDWVRRNLAEPIVGAIQKVIEVIGNVIDWIKDRFLGAWKAIKEPVLAVIGAFVTAIQTLIGWIRDAINWLSQLGKGVGEALAEKAIGGGIFDAIDGAQHGGIITKTGLAVVHKGEVFSGVNNEMGFGGISGDIVLNVDGQTFARITRDQLLKLQKRNATSGI
jgi:TP901 family phage tail tape measure protein